MALSVRARLTLWYAIVVIVILAVSSAAMLTLQTRLALRRLDAELERLSATVLTILGNEIDERHEMVAAAADAIAEAGIEGRTVVILDNSGRVLATSEKGPSPGLLVSPSPPGLTSPVDNVRMIAVRAAHAGLAYEIRIAASLDVLAEERRTLLEILVAGMSLALLAAGIGGWIIGRQALRPLVAMAHEAGAMATVSSQARLTLPASDDELEALGRAFNGLLERLDQALSAQRQFMADASHELRTPVSVTRTAAQVTLGRTHRSEDEYRESLTIVAEQAKRLTRMVDDMFLLARADADARPIERSALYLNELVAECVRAVRVLAEPKGVHVTALAEHDVPFMGDENLLRQMLMNLIENAVTHTPAGGNVVVELNATETSVALTVTDSGPGVPAADRDRIFQRFVRLAPLSAPTGAGLGLPIARWVAEGHGGTLILQPVPAGSRFLVTLPLHTPPA